MRAVRGRRGKLLIVHHEWLMHRMQSGVFTSVSNLLFLMLFHSILRHVQYHQQYLPVVHGGVLPHVQSVLIVRRVDSGMQGVQRHGVLCVLFGVLPQRQGVCHLLVRHWRLRNVFKLVHVHVMRHRPLRRGPDRVRVMSRPDAAVRRVRRQRHVHGVQCGVLSRPAVVVPRVQQRRRSLCNVLQQHVVHRVQCRLHAGQRHVLRAVWHGLPGLLRLQHHGAGVHDMQHGVLRRVRHVVRVVCSRHAQLPDVHWCGGVHAVCLGLHAPECLHVHAVRHGRPQLQLVLRSGLHVRVVRGRVLRPDDDHVRAVHVTLRHVQHHGHAVHVVHCRPLSDRQHVPRVYRCELHHVRECDDLLHVCCGALFVQCVPVSPVLVRHRVVYCMQQRHVMHRVRRGHVPRQRDAVCRVLRGHAWLCGVQQRHDVHGVWHGVVSDRVPVVCPVLCGDARLPCVQHERDGVHGVQCGDVPRHPVVV